MYHDAYRSALLVPHIVIVCRPYPEAVSPRRQVGIRRAVLRAYEVPVFVKSFQLISILVLLRRTVTQSRILQCNNIVFIREMDFVQAVERSRQYTSLFRLDGVIEYLQSG